MHCFSGDARVCPAMRRAGIHRLVLGHRHLPRAENIQDAARTVANDGYVVETDSPFLSPVPHARQADLPERSSPPGGQRWARLRGAPGSSGASCDNRHPPIASSGSRRGARQRRVSDHGARRAWPSSPRPHRPQDAHRGGSSRRAPRRDTSLGQHFLIDRDVLDAIVDALDPGPDQRGSRDRLRAREPSPERCALRRAPRGSRSISTRPASREPRSPSAGMRTSPGSRQDASNRGSGSPRLHQGVAGDRATFPISSTGLVLMRLVEAEDPPARAVVLVQSRSRAHGSRPVRATGVSRPSPSAASAEVERIRDVPPHAFDPPPAVAFVDHQDRALGES